MPSLRILGCGDAFNSGGLRHTSFLLTGNKHEILIDCGANTVLAFKQLGLSFKETDCVVITHFHGDHYGGLPYLILEAAEVQKRTKPLLIISPPGLKDNLYHLMTLLYKGSEKALEQFPVTYMEFSAGTTIKVPFGFLTAYEVQHKPETLPHGVRLEMEGSVFSYSGDSAWHQNLKLLANGASLFVCDCNFFDKESNSHLHYKLIEQQLPGLKAKKVYLTHAGEEMLSKSESQEIPFLQEGEVIFF